MQNPIAQPKLRTLCNIGTKRTITNHKPYVICNQITHNTSDIKSTPKQKYFYTQQITMDKEQCRGLSFGAEPRIGRNPFKAKLQDSSS